MFARQEKDVLLQNHLSEVKRELQLDGIPSPVGFAAVESADPQEFILMDQHRPRVLIVDDDLEIRETLAAGLASLECEVMTARDGVEALSMTEVRAPQIVILDLLMPRRGGMAVLHQLKAGRQTGRRYVLMSGSMNERVTQMALELGADVCLQKPFGMPHFLQTVRRLLDTNPATATSEGAAH